MLATSNSCFFTKGRDRRGWARSKCCWTNFRRSVLETKNCSVSYSRRWMRRGVWEGRCKTWPSNLKILSFLVMRMCGASRTTWCRSCVCKNRKMRAWRRWWSDWVPESRFPKVAMNKSSSSCMRWRRIGNDFGRNWSNMSTIPIIIVHLWAICSKQSLRRMTK